MTHIRRKNRALRLVALVVVPALAIGAVCDEMLMTQEPVISAPRPAATVTAPPVRVTMTATQTIATVTARAPSFGDGMYLVGSGVRPGLYISPGPTDPQSWGACSYELDNTADDPLRALIDASSVRGPVVLHITDKVFEVKVHGCKPFVRLTDPRLP